MNDNARNDAERLDALWDRFNRDGSRHHTETSDDVVFIASLYRDLPRLSNPARERIRHRVFSPAKGAPGTMSTLAAAPERGDLIAPLPAENDQWNRNRFDSPWLRIAAMLLLAVSFIGGWAALRGDGDGPHRGVTTYPAMTGSTPGPEISAPIDGPMIWSVQPIEIELPGDETEVRLLLNEVTIEPSASWVVPYDIANLLRVTSGNLTITGNMDDSTTELTGGDLVSFGSGTTLTLANHGDVPVVVTHGLVLLPEAGEFTADLQAGVAIKPIGLGTLFASGTVTVMLSSERINPTGTSTFVHGEAFGYRLYAVQSGSITVTRLAGTMDVQRHGEAPRLMGTLEAIGDSIELQAGDALMAHPDAAYRIETTGSGEAQVAFIAVLERSKSEPQASPVASPMAETPLPSAETMGSLIQVVATDCTIAPRPLDEFAAILADPFANGTPIANMQSESVAGMPADDETIAGVTDTIVQVVACNSPASIEMYSLYSENALRFQAMYGMTIAEIEGLPGFEPGDDPERVLGHVSIENITLLPDGRVTAMVNANGEIAFVTFVFENGRWLVDFWDDSLEN